MAHIEQIHESRASGRPENIYAATKATTILAAATLSGILGAACAFADDPLVSKLEGATTEQIIWGKHWAGPELRGARSLEGKVVLLKIWGG